MNESTDLLQTYKKKYKALLFGSLGIIFMAIAIITYLKLQINVLGLSTVITYEGNVLTDGFSLALIFLSLSLLFSIIGFIYSLVNKKIIGILLSLITLITIPVISNYNNQNLMDTVSKYKIEKRINTMTRVTEDTIFVINKDINKTTPAI